MKNRCVLFILPTATIALAACSLPNLGPAPIQSGGFVSELQPIAHGGSFKVVYEFPGGSGGSTPLGGLTFLNKTYYGTTNSGGNASACAPSGCGTVFAGKKVIYAFNGVDSKDGAQPGGALLHVGDKLYGVTAAGGRSDGGCRANVSGPGCGTVYSIDTAGNESVIYRFKGGSDGEAPVGGLVAMNGVLYGVTAYGGANKFCLVSSGSVPEGCGVVFSIDSSGHERVMYRFQGGSDGAFPLAAPVVVSGTLYGTTFEGGSGCSYTDGCGTVYSLTASGTEAIVDAFKGGTDALWPQPLIAVKGSLYGTSSVGGCLQSCHYPAGFGTLFKVSVTGKETILHRFTAKANDGGHPEGPLVFLNGGIYGTTVNGGAHAAGTIFSMTGKSFTLHHSFARPPAPYDPGGFALDESTGALYGEALEGGSNSAGGIFRYLP